MDEFWSLKMERQTTSLGYALLRLLVLAQSPSLIQSRHHLRLSVVTRNNFD